jgi:hypothetical protein
MDSILMADLEGRYSVGLNRSNPDSRGRVLAEKLINGDGDQNTPAVLNDSPITG